MNSKLAIPKPEPSSDPEERIQEYFNNPVTAGVAWLTFWSLAIWTTVSRLPVRAWRWLRTKQVCAWCKPQRRVSGNPFARRISHSICDRCLERSLAELTKR